MLILYTTLFPFDFVIKSEFSIRTIVEAFDLRILKPGLIDWLRNVLLFVPFGFGGAAMVAVERQRRSFVLVLMPITGILIALLVEVLQVFLSVREASVSDVLANGLGSFFGAALFNAHRATFLALVRWCAGGWHAWSSPKRLTIVFAAVGGVVLLTPLFLSPRTDFTNWDHDFPLAVGNERMGGHPWDGRIDELLIANRAIPKQQLVAGLSAERVAPLLAGSILSWYRFRGGNPEYDRDRAPFSPRLVPRRAGSGFESFYGAGIADRTDWLQTAIPPAGLLHGLAQTGQFTIVISLATADLNQTGPARILSIEGDASRSNLAICQEEGDLIIRLRTPVTGERRLAPEFVVPNVFTDTGPRLLAAGYSGSTLTLYDGRLDQITEFRIYPEFRLFRFLLPVSVWRISGKKGHISFLELLFHLVLFFPLGMVAAQLNIALSRTSRLCRLLLIGGSMLLICLGFEAIRAGISMRDLALHHLAWSGLAAMLGWKS